MEDTSVIEVSAAGELVTVDKETFAFPTKFFDDSTSLTMYPWDNVSIKPGTIGLILSFKQASVCLAKVLWTVEGEGKVLYTNLENLKVLNYKKDQGDE